VAKIGKVLTFQAGFLKHLQHLKGDRAISKSWIMRTILYMLHPKVGNPSLLKVWTIHGVVQVISPKTKLVSVPIHGANQSSTISPAPRYACKNETLDERNVKPKNKNKKRKF
jgi:hypothetical protein